MTYTQHNTTHLSTQVDAAYAMVDMLLKPDDDSLSFSLSLNKHKRMHTA